MRRRFIVVLAIIISLSITLSAQATILIVDNNPDSEIANYTNIQTASDGASSGDTLYVMGSGVNYGDMVIRKQLFVFGPGNFLGENEDTQAVLTSAMVSAVTFWRDPSGALDADGSMMTGMFLSHITYIEAHDITVKRNRYSVNSTSIHCKSTSSNVLIIGNYIECYQAITAYTTVYIEGASYVTIENNFIYKSGSSIAIMVTSAATGVEIHYNVVNGLIETYNSNLHSNLLYNGGFTNGGSSNNYSNNIGDSDQFGTANGNQSNVDMATVFVNSGSTDGRYMLATGSPAIGTGLNDEDCGMFGGPNPYVLSGIPVIPTITSFIAPNTGSTTQGLPVEITVKARP
jgi:hypothetical protein